MKVKVILGSLTKWQLLIYRNDRYVTNQEND